MRGQRDGYDLRISIGSESIYFLSLPLDLIMLCCNLICSSHKYGFLTLNSDNFDGLGVIQGRKIFHYLFWSGLVLFLNDDQVISIDYLRNQVWA